MTGTCDSIQQFALEAQEKFALGANPAEVFRNLLESLRGHFKCTGIALAESDHASFWSIESATGKFPSWPAAASESREWEFARIPGDRQTYLVLHGFSLESLARIRGEVRGLLPALGLMFVCLRERREQESAFARVETLQEERLGRLQSDLFEAQKTMVESAKFSALGVMAAGIAHEINNPLAIIQAYSDILEDFENLNEVKAKRCRQAISRSVDRISKIVRGLRKVARDAEGDPFEWVTLKTILEELMAFSQERILHLGIDLRIDFDETLSFHCQPVQISQVLLNMLNNAIDALEERSEDRWISIDAKKDGDRAVIRFADSGTGVPKNIRHQIFEPFFTTKQVGKGTGLGLSISRSIIQDHGGKFYLSEESDSTCFVIEMPVASAATGAQSA